MTRGDAGRVPGDALAVAARSRSPSCSSCRQPVGEEAEVHARPAASRRGGASAAAEPLSRVSTTARSSSRVLDAVGDRVQDAGALLRRQVAAQAGKAACAAATAASTSAAVPAGDLAERCCSSIGETSVKVGRRGDALAADPVPGVDVDARDRDDVFGHALLLRSPSVVGSTRRRRCRDSSESAAVPDDADLAVVAADRARRISSRASSSVGDSKSSQLDVAAPGRSRLERRRRRTRSARRGRGRALLDGGQPAVVGHRVRVDEAVGLATARAG